MKLVITGATGAIGLSFISKMTRCGCVLTILVNPGSSRNKRFEMFPEVTLVEASIADYSQVELEGEFDAFVHMAWNGGKDRGNAVVNFDSAMASKSAVDLAARLGCKVFLSTGSQAEYGLTSGQIDELTPCWPDTTFGIAKLASMHLTRNACIAKGIRHIWLRVFSAYGPFDGEQTMIVSTVCKVLAGETPRFTSGVQLWDFIHTDDIADAMYSLLSNERCEGLYVVGYGKKQSLKDYFAIMSEQLGFNLDESIGKVETKNSVQRNLWVDCSKLQTDTNWEPKIGFDKGLETVVEYCKEST